MFFNIFAYTAGNILLVTIPLFYKRFFDILTTDIINLNVVSALSEYKGALLVISHDIDFVRKLGPSKLLFIKNKTLKSLSINDLSEIEDISNLL